ncbi:MAG TPA: hypothetical protein VLI90_16435, partial [Tepidisphaeraceae bacterium]|nr:hypothetical protein [Tepidisphaeraceae bacterium]
MNTLERPRRSRRRRQRRGERRREAAAIVFVTLLALATISLVTWPLWKSPSPSAASGAPSSGAGNIELASVTTIPASTSHPVYKYSVIPGGARNGEELAQAIRHDPVVARHYRSVSPDRVRVERLTQPRRAYVSYRVGDRVYWTNHRVTLPAGELILTDGVTQIRARCGNCISDKAQLPTSGGEPDSAELDTLSPVPLPLEQPLPGTVMAWNSAGA